MHGLGLALEALPCMRCQVIEDFHRDGAVQHKVSSLVDEPKTARAKNGLESIAALQATSN
jgi:hypothetical protein